MSSARSRSCITRTTPPAEGVDPNLTDSRGISEHRIKVLTFPGMKVNTRKTSAAGGKTFVQRWCDALEADERIGHTTWAVLYRLSMWADWWTGDNCRPGHRRLALATRLCMTTVRHHIRIGIDLGYIEIVKRAHGGQGKSRATIYRLVMPRERHRPLEDSVRWGTVSAEVGRSSSESETPSPIDDDYQSLTPCTTSISRTQGKTEAESQRDESGDAFTPRRDSKERNEEQKRGNKPEDAFTPAGVKRFSDEIRAGVSRGNAGAPHE